MKDMNDMKGMLNETFSDYQPTPPKDLWPEIERRANNKQGHKGLWIYLSAAAAVILILVGISLSFKKDENRLQLVPTGEKSIAKIDSLPAGSLKKSDHLAVEITESAPVLKATKDSSNNISTPHRQTSIVNHNLASNDPVHEAQDLQAGFEHPDTLSSSLSKLAQIHPIRISASKSPTLSIRLPISTDQVPPPGDHEQQLSDMHQGLQPVSVSENRSNKLTLEYALFIASEEIDKRIKNSPLEASEVDLEDQDASLRTIKFQIGSFKITRKKVIQTNS